MGRQKSYDYIIIGSGTAGTKAAVKHAHALKKVAIIEAEEWGGSYANTHDVPYQTALEFSHLYYLARQGVKMGLSSSHLGYNYPSVLNYRNRIIRQARTDAKQHLVNAGAECIKGFAHFVGKNELVVNGKHLTAKKIIIATGTEFLLPKITGLSYIKYFTSDNAFTIKRPPKRLVVIGGGQSGCMIAQYYAELGSEVTLIEQRNRLVAKEDKDTSKNWHQWLSHNLNVKIHLSANVTAMQNGITSATQKVTWRSDQTTKYCITDAVVLATGYSPATDCGLENARVNYSKRGIITKNNRTSNKRIWATGDVLA